jgi:anti-sigma regulatory factor (Ser/Thr protein kinase)
MMDLPPDPPGPATGPGRAPGRGAQRVAQQVLPHSDEAPAIGRAFVSDALRRWKLDALVETAALLTSELVTNAVVHARSTSSLTVQQIHDAIRVELLDRGHGRVALRRSSPGAVGGGRGLFIVEQLATAWGSRDTPAGTTVWFELATDASPAARRSGARQDSVARSASNTDRTAR